MPTLQYVKDLGNDTPDIIRRINSMVFRTLVDLATGQKEIYSALQTLCDEIPWDELELQAVEKSRSWFSAGKDIVLLLQFFHRSSNVHYRLLQNIVVQLHKTCLFWPLTSQSLLQGNGPSVIICDEKRDHLSRSTALSHPQKINLYYYRLGIVMLGRLP